MALQHPDDCWSFVQLHYSGWSSCSCLFCWGVLLVTLLLIGACSCRRRNIFEDVYGVGVRRGYEAMFEDITATGQYSYDEWRAWVRKAIVELKLLEEGNFAQVGALACALVFVFSCSLVLLCSGMASRWSRPYMNWNPTSRTSRWNLTTTSPTSTSTSTVHQCLD